MLTHLEHDLDWQYNHNCVNCSILQQVTESILPMEPFNIRRESAFTARLACCIYALTRWCQQTHPLISGRSASVDSVLLLHRAHTCTSLVCLLPAHDIRQATGSAAGRKLGDTGVLAKKRQVVVLDENTSTQDRNFYRHLVGRHDSFKPKCELNVVAVCLWSARRYALACPFYML